MLGKNLVISCLNICRVSVHLNECCTFQRIKPLLMCGVWIQKFLQVGPKVI